MRCADLRSNGPILSKQPEPFSAPYDPMSPVSDIDSPSLSPQTLPISDTTSHPTFAHRPQVSAAKLFTPEELAVLPEGVLDRQKQKQLAKKAKKKRAVAERTEDELMFGFMDMGVEEPKKDQDADFKPSKKTLRKQKKNPKVVERPTEREMDEEARKEAEFAKFLANVRGEYEDAVVYADVSRG